MNLKPRFLLLTGLLIVASATAAWYASRQLAENIVAQWAIRYAEKQVLYDKSRLLQPIVREIALSRQFANSQEIRNWARDPEDPALTRRALAEMENYRLTFSDRSYFVALRDSGRYYHNNAKNEFAGKPYRYTLSPKKPEDRWFYDIIRQQRDIHINVNPDANLGVTKLWIDVLVRDGDAILGVAGTGLDLTELIHAVVDQTQPGMTSLFVDHNGAIQAHRDQRLIDFASISKTAHERKTLDLLFERPQDREAIYAAMKELESVKSTVISRFVEIEGRRHLAGVAYLPEIDWYEITLLDLNVLVPLSSFSGILLVYGLTLLAALALFNLVLSRLVLRPLKNLELAMREAEQGQHGDVFPPTQGKGEISLLIEHFRRMARAQWEARRDLESKVNERTEALDRLAKTDPLTELLNRRGMSERIEAEISRSRREHSRIGLLLVDIDLFKEINDQHGHGKGDEALKAVASLIHAMLRPYDSVARWGGDEFLVLTQASDAHDLDAQGERIRAAIAETCHIAGAAGSALPLTISVGGYFANNGEDIESMLQHADKALYMAKDAGRNCYRAYGEVRSSAT
ncbi:MAG: diguanylate cyclase [Pseudomonadota bacterium]|nr:diguanylate cyclase [Pseudomonadota bacterium]MDP1905541.1 diguanylate cyclase [Pseudomonadota bacterium]MDP2352280.1 diguanylate cyclase [Pseudomonadota bacterium]